MIVACNVSLLDYVLLVSYCLLLVVCGNCIYQHREALFEGKAGSLSIFLTCSFLLVLGRSIAFLIHILFPFVSISTYIDGSVECDVSGSSWMWISPFASTSIIDSSASFFSFIAVVLSTLSYVLYVSSYSHFAFSFCKVLNMLLHAQAIKKALSVEKNILFVFSLLYSVLWATWTVLLIFLTFNGLHDGAFFCKQVIIGVPGFLGLYCGFFPLKSLFLLSKYDSSYTSFHVNSSSYLANL